MCVFVFQREKEEEEELKKRVVTFLYFLAKKRCKDDELIFSLSREDKENSS